MKKLFILLFLSLSLFVQSQEYNSLIIKQGKTIEEFVPKNWKIIYKSDGDLNKDKIKDVAFVIENTAKENFILNDGLGGDTLNINPRFLLILFKNELGYKLQSVNEDFIPSQNDAESTCLADSFLQDGGMEIINGILIINLRYWLSCGSWEVSDKVFKFKFQNNKFELIGYDSWNFHRASGEKNTESINFLTKKKQLVTGLNEFEESKPITVWKNIKINKLLNLEELTADSEINF
ncbi:hypothetical protein [Flavobacterium sp.]|uniref:hypothetical protein n=1 Tax=Flavobacterium sp. TaxID=239 RepID=UPI0037503015